LRSHVIREVGLTIECNSFSKLQITNDGRVRPKHIVTRRGTITSCVVDGNILHEINDRGSNKATYVGLY
jgi:hypothetical protein